ncbi:MAG: carboxypeptidase-like regulatory domain-containing protein [Thermoanaerobaculia bacterium]
MRRQKIRSVTIPEPCTEPWEKMATLDGDRRFCEHCQHEVIDFSRASDGEILATLSRASGRVCGRLTQTQLNRLRSISPPQSSRPAAALVAASLVAAVALPGPASAAPPTKPSPVAAKASRSGGRAAVAPAGHRQGRPGGRWVLSGRVVNESGEPLPGATVHIAGTSLVRITDEEGKFRWDIARSNSPRGDLILEARLSGFEQTSTVVTEGDEQPRQLVLLVDLGALPVTGGAIVVGVDSSERPPGRR